MRQRRSRKCLHCGTLFRPDPRNLRHQRYCSAPECRKASKAASQRRWLVKRGNRDYFRGPAHVERVREWRRNHPEYWKRSQRRSALQEDSCTQPFVLKRKTGALVSSALQDVLSSESFVLLGLIANLTGSTLQEDIASTGRRLLRLGYDIAQGESTLEGGDHADETRVVPGAPAPGTGPVQLGGSPSGP